MKKLFILMSISFILLFSISSNTAAQTKNLTQGMYNITNAKLQPGINYKIRNTSTSKSLILVIDNNQIVQQLMRLEPTSPEYILKPFNLSDTIIVIGAGNLEFS